VTPVRASGPVPRSNRDHTTSPARQRRTGGRGPRRGLPHPLRSASVVSHDLDGLLLLVPCDVFQSLTPMGFASPVPAVRRERRGGPRIPPAARRLLESVDNPPRNSWVRWRARGEVCRAMDRSKRRRAVRRDGQAVSPRRRITAPAPGRGPETTPRAGAAEVHPRSVPRPGLDPVAEASVRLVEGPARANPNRRASRSGDRDDPGGVSDRRERLRRATDHLGSVRTLRWPRPFPGLVSHGEPRGTCSASGRSTRPAFLPSAVQRCTASRARPIRVRWEHREVHRPSAVRCSTEYRASPFRGRSCHREASRSSAVRRRTANRASPSHVGPGHRSATFPSAVRRCTVDRVRSVCVGSDHRW
jgi:hypothetical protein